MKNKLMKNGIVGCVTCVLLSLGSAAFAADAAIPERSLTKQTGWWWYYGKTAGQINALTKSNKARIIDIEVERTSPLKFSVAMVRNSGVHKSGWWWYYGQSADSLKKTYTRLKARILDLEVYRVGGKKRFAAVLVPNTGSKSMGWWWYYGKSAKQINSLARANKARVIDIEVERTSPYRFSAVLVKNTGKTRSGWWWYYGKTSAQVNTLARQKKARILDIESYVVKGKRRYAAVLLPNTRADYWWWYTGLNGQQLQGLSRRHGSRIIDVETSVRGGKRRFFAVLLDNGMIQTGKAVPALRSFDRSITKLVKKWNIPGAAVAVAYDGRLVYARGFGLADVEKNKAVQPSDLFRIASISKPLTRSAIFKLRDAGKLKLSDKAFNHLKNLRPSKVADKRIDNITIQNLLDHKGGWDIGKNYLGFDPMFFSNQIAKKMGTPRPTSCENVIRYMLRFHKLSHKPGQTSAYSNFGYCILGRIVEKASGKSYQQFVRSNVLAPAGIHRLRMGRTLLAKRAKGEVRYYHHPFSSLVTTVFPSGPSKVPSPYGGWHLEAMDSHGGWISSAVDLVRFAKSAKPAPYSGNWSFNGSLPGTRSRVVRSNGGKLIMSAVFNTRPQKDKIFGDQVAAALTKAGQAVTSWPTHDLFSSFP